MTPHEDPSRPDALWTNAWRGVLFASARGGRVTVEQQQAVADALAVFWSDAGDSSEPSAVA